MSIPAPDRGGNPLGLGCIVIAVIVLIYIISRFL